MGNNPYFRELETEGIRPIKIFEGDDTEAEPVKKQAYAEIYQSDPLPRLIADKKKANLAQFKRRQKQNINDYTEDVKYKQAFLLLHEVKFGQERAMKMFFTKCIEDSLKKVMEDIGFNGNQSMVQLHIQRFAATIIAQFLTMLEIQPPAEEVKPEIKS